MVKKVTKESIILEDPSLVSQVIDFAFMKAISGRKGPVWIDIPIDVQSTLLDDKFINLIEKPLKSVFSENNLEEPFANENEIDELAKRIMKSHRPTLYVGNGIRLSNSYDDLLKFLEKWPISTVTGWNSNDLLWDDHYCYAGRPGSVGNRAGNFAVQLSDCLVTIGCRLNIRQVSFNWKSFAKNAWKCHIDIDQDELEKPTLDTDLKIKTNIKGFFEKLDKKLNFYKNKIKNNPQLIYWEKWRLFNKNNLIEFPYFASKDNTI